MSSNSKSTLYKCWCKATNREIGEPRYSYNWLFSRRAWFKVFSDRIECGHWCIPFSDVTEVVVFHTRQMLLPATVLRVRTRVHTYQFGFNPWANPIKYISITYREEQVGLKYSVFSIALRVGVVLCILYWLWTKIN